MDTLLSLIFNRALHERNRMKYTNKNTHCISPKPQNSNTSTKNEILTCSTIISNHLFRSSFLYLFIDLSGCTCDGRERRVSIGKYSVNHTSVCTRGSETVSFEFLRQSYSHNNHIISWKSRNQHHML